MSVNYYYLCSKLRVWAIISLSSTSSPTPRGLQTIKRAEEKQNRKKKKKKNCLLDLRIIHHRSRSSVISSGRCLRDSRGLAYVLYIHLPTCPVELLPAAHGGLCAGFTHLRNSMYVHVICEHPVITCMYVHVPITIHVNITVTYM